MSDQPRDDREIRCRMLGHPVPFGYCKELPEGRPCRLIVECWQGLFDMKAYLADRYTPEEIEAILAPPKPKMLSLVELIEKARQAQQNAGEGDS